MAIQLTPTASQIASSKAHLDRRDSWRYYRVDGVRYIAMTSGTSGIVYNVRADAAGCSCPAYQKRGYSVCSHMLAAREAANHDALAAWLGEPAPVQPKQADRPKPLKRYEDLMPTCKATGCQDDPERGEPFCWRHAVVSAF